MTYDEVKEDYNKIISDYGLPDDLGGAFVEGDWYQELLLNPCKLIAKYHMKSIIEFGFQFGEFWRCESNKGFPDYIDKPIDNDNFLTEMYNKYA